LLLTVSDPTESRRFAGIIEEALRLASLPGESEGRHYHFRYIRLGRIYRHESPSLIALRLGNEFLRLAAQAVHVEDPRAPDADAVYFQSPIEPLRLALRRLVRGLPIDLWFLRAAFPKSRETANPPEMLRSLLEVSAQLPGGIINTVYLLDEILELRELELLLPWLTREAVIAIAPEFESVPRSPAPARYPRLSPSWAAVVEQAVALWGRADLRCRWLALIAFAAQAPARIGDAELKATSVALTERIAAARTRLGAPHVSETTPSQDRRTEDLTSQSQETRRTHEQSAKRTRQEPATRSKMLAAETPPEDSVESEYSPGVYSSHSGFFFLLRVLDELDIEEFLRVYPLLAEVNFPWLVLRALAEYLCFEEDDPHVSMAPSSCADVLQNKIAFDMPEAWSRLFGLRPATESFEITLRSLLRIWVIAARRWLWLYGRLRLNEVTNRRGQVFYSRPQVDVKLRLQDVDLRIRRLGLDLDPGWVPWLGLIVRFHYEHSLGDGHAA
jgi:hypothetical protein